MASGFITLPDGKNWAVRWSGYDWVLETIMKELSVEGDEGVLKKWIEYILPNEDKGDIESGYCFYKKVGENESDVESILRVIDTRLMKSKFQIIFWNTVKKVSQRLSIKTNIGVLMNQLNDSYKLSLKAVAKEPEDMGLKEIFFLNGFELAEQ